MMGSTVSAGKHVSLISFLLTILLVLAGSVYLMKAAYARDALWFWPTFDVLPAQVEIRCHGQRTLLDGSSSEALRLASLVNEQISGKKQFDPLSLSEATHAYYLTDPEVVTLELIYSSPVRIHLPTMYFSGITSLLLPLEGRYANSNTVFGLINGHASGGSIHIESNQSILNALDEYGICGMP